MEDFMTISVKGMVCDRCKKVIAKAMHSLGLAVNNIQLGSITLSGTSALSSLDPIQQQLEENGFELLNDRNTAMVSEIKRLIDEVFNNSREEIERPKLSRLITDKFPFAYDTLSAIFSSHEGITLEKYIIHKRLEKVKELLVYTDYTLTEIAYRTGYSSVYHLSSQFKELTGLPPSHFRDIRARKKLISNPAKALMEG